MSSDAAHKTPPERFLEALNRLEEALRLPSPSLLEQEGTVRRMSFAIEAGWKALRFALEQRGQAPQSPTPPAVLTAAWRNHMLFNGENWMEMLTRRSGLVRDDSPETLHTAMTELRTRFFPELVRLREWLINHPLP